MENQGSLNLAGMGIGSAKARHLIESIVALPDRRLLCVVDPPLAQELLKSNWVNRSLRPSHVKFLASMMRDGVWQKFHPAGVLVAEDTHLLDGQHRLQAVVQSGCSVWMTLHVADSKDVKRFVDIGIIRRLYDVYQFHAEAWRSQLIAGLVNMDEQIRLGHTEKVTPERAVVVFEEHRSSFTWMANSIRSNSHGMRKAPILLAICHLYERNQALAIELYDSFCVPGGPCQQGLMLRDFALSSVGKNGYDNRVTEYWKAVGCCRALLRGDKVKRVVEVSSW